MNNAPVAGLVWICKSRNSFITWIHDCKLQWSLRIFVKTELKGPKNAFRIVKLYLVHCQYLHPHFCGLLQIFAVVMSNDNMHFGIGWLVLLTLFKAILLICQLSTCMTIVSCTPQSTLKTDCGNRNMVPLPESWAILFAWVSDDLHLNCQKRRELNKAYCKFLYEMLCLLPQANINSPNDELVLSNASSARLLSVATNSGVGFTWSLRGSSRILDADWDPLVATRYAKKKHKKARNPFLHLR